MFHVHNWRLVAVRHGPHVRALYRCSACCRLRRVTFDSQGPQAREIIHDVYSRYRR